MFLHDEAATAEIMFSHNPENGLVLPVDNLMGLEGAYPVSAESENVVSAEQAELLEQHHKMKSADSGLMLPEEYLAKDGVISKTANFLRRSRVGRAVTAAAIGVSLAGGYSLVNADTAKADTGTPVCTTSPGGDSTTCVYPPDGQDPNSPDNPAPNNPPKNGNDGGNGNNDNHQGGKNNQPDNGGDSADNSQINFRGYNMEDTAFTDHNGCFITSAASALRRVTGDSHITPRKIYYPALRKLWSPSAGVKGGLLFDALPSIASHYDVKVYKIDNARGALRAVSRGDQVQMLAAAPSHFTYGGHYLDARATTPNGKKLILDDPNGNGLHGDSERASGWSPSQLKSAGIIGYRGLHLIQR